MLSKTWLCLLVMLGMSAAALAQPGPPYVSNKAGYVMLTVPVGSTPFGLPFRFWDVPALNTPTYGAESRRPSDIVGTQANCGSLITADRIVRQGGTAPFAWRIGSTGCGWTGTLETGATMMDPGVAYWYVNRSGATRSLVLCGEADTTGDDIPTVNVNAPTNPGGTNSVAYSWRDPREVARSRLNLLEAGFRGGTINTSDRVIEQGGNARAFYYTTVWSGTLPGVVPGRAYWIVNKHYGLPGWTYTYLALPMEVVQPVGDGEQMRAAPPVIKPLTKQKNVQSR